MERAVQCQDLVAIACPSDFNDNLSVWGNENKYQKEIDVSRESSENVLLNKLGKN